jgi:pilus assembly protein TadC
MAWHSMSTSLDFPDWVSLAGASVVELLGLATINTAFEFWSYNQDKRQRDGKAPVVLAMGIAVFYLSVVLTVNTMLDQSPAIYRIAKALLSSLTIAGGVIIALRAGHSKRLDAIQVERQEQREMRRMQRSVSIPFCRLAQLPA